jgi:hypothetical protein
MKRALPLLLAACSSSPTEEPAPDMAALAPYTIAAFDHVVISSQSDQPNFQKAQASIDFHDGPFAQATLIVDLESPCYPFDKWKSDRPPAGQNWPADCDAFDRNFEFTFEDLKLELARAITPFGGPEHFTADVTDLANGAPGMHTLQAFIATWSDAAGKVSGSRGQWIVSARLELTPGDPPRKVLAVVPLVNLSQDATTPPPMVDFTVPAGATHARLEYRATGHGGASDSSLACNGPAEEFCQRSHHVLLDGADQTPTLVPWRDDCDQLCTMAHYPPNPGDGGVAGFDYCMENPCGAIASVQAPRANWCPGSMTPPILLDDGPWAQPGAHKFSYAIDGVAPGGSWRLSAVLYVFQ